MTAELSLTVAGCVHRAALHMSIDISLALADVENAVTVFGAGHPSSQPLRVGSFVGDVQQGGSCNCRSHVFTPHCHGTHTESVAHLTVDPWPVAQLARGLYLAQLLTVTPEQQRIDAQQLREALCASSAGAAPQAVIVRTLPNTPAKAQRNYDAGSPPAYFTSDALAWLAQQGVDHLLTDLPSVDPLQDGGRLAAHRAFWHIPPHSQRLAEVGRPQATITELVYVPEHVADGHYLLNLQIAPLASDAAPSRPLLYPLIQ